MVHFLRLLLQREPHILCTFADGKHFSTFIMHSIILITGGQRSGKSAYAERLALQLSEKPLYLATAHVSDDEMATRVARHRQRRGPQWSTIEEERHLSRHDMTGRVVLVDCLTTWIANRMLAAEEHDMGDDALLQQLLDELDQLMRQQTTFIFVTNEVGMGGISANAMQRRFADLQGWVNQHVAQRADKVVLMVSGLPIKVKG